jgi:hypothetical protein
MRIILSNTMVIESGPVTMAKNPLKNMISAEIFNLAK